MRKRGVSLGFCLVCLALGGALGVQSAGATTGTTAFTCQEQKSFSYPFFDSHCKEGAPGIGKFQHVAITEKTFVSISDVTTGAAFEVMRLKATVAGIAFELATKFVNGSGLMENVLNGKEHVARGEGSITAVAEVTKPAGKGCRVYTDEGGAKGSEGIVDSKELSATTEAAGMGIVFKPKEGGVLATFIIAGCEGAFASLNKTYGVEGSLIGTPEGATVKFTHEGTTTQNTLKLNGTIKAGLEGSLTYTGPLATPLTVTTVET